MGPDVNEPNEYQANAAFVGSGRRSRSNTPRSSRTARSIRACPATTITTAWSPKRPARSTSRSTSSCTRGLLPDGGNLNLEVLDANGNVIASAPGTFRRGRHDGERPRPHPGGGRAELLPARFRPTADGEGPSAVVNGYDVTIIDTPPPVPFNLELSRSVLAVTITNGGTGYTSAPTVTFSGGGATTQATGIAILSGGSVTARQNPHQRQRLHLGADGRIHRRRLHHAGHGDRRPERPWRLAAQRAQRRQRTAQFDNVTYVNTPNHLSAAGRRDLAERFAGQWHDGYCHRRA